MNLIVLPFVIGMAVLLGEDGWAGAMIFISALARDSRSRQASSCMVYRSLRSWVTCVSFDTCLGETGATPGVTLSTTWRTSTRLSATRRNHASLPRLCPPSSPGHDPDRRVLWVECPPRPLVFQSVALVFQWTTTCSSKCRRHQAISFSPVKSRRLFFGTERSKSGSSGAAPCSAAFSARWFGRPSFAPTSRSRKMSRPSFRPPLLSNKQESTGPLC